MTAEQNQSRFIVPHELVIHNIALLKLSGMRNIPWNNQVWGLEEYTKRAREIGDAKLMYEPNRLVASRVRRQLEHPPFSGEVAKDIPYLSEPSRSEDSIFEYLNGSLLWKLFYTYLEQVRFSEETSYLLERLQGIVKRETQNVAVRVNEKHETRPSAILDEHLQNKIYYLPQWVWNDAFEDARYITDRKRKAHHILHRVVEHVSQQQVSGIELGLQNITTLVNKDHELLEEIMNVFMNARHPHRDEVALIQSVSVQPNRVDFPTQVPYNAMQHAIEKVQESNFKGLVLFSPGDGKDVEENSRDLRQKLLTH